MIHSEIGHVHLRIDYYDQWRFGECSHISRASCMIWTHYTSLEASEFPLSYHITKCIIRLSLRDRKFFLEFIK